MGALLPIFFPIKIMFKKFVICAVGLSAGVGAAWATNDAVVEMLGGTPNVENKESMEGMVDDSMADKDSVAVGGMDDAKSSLMDSKPTTVEASGSGKKIEASKTVEHAIDSQIGSQKKAVANLAEGSDDKAEPKVEDKPKVSAETLAAFDSEEFGNGDLKYRIHSPRNIKIGKKYPLILFLHGSGERGSDNVAQLTHGATEFVKWANGEAFLVFPQCPQEQRWANSTNSESTQSQGLGSATLAMESTIGLMQDLIHKKPVDAKRVYAVGLSMGGHGTFDIVARQPEMFAAAAGICGAGVRSSEVIERMSSVPMYIAHGADDTVVPVSDSIELADALKKAGGNVAFFELPNTGHDSWTPTFKDPEFYQWMFAHRNNSARKNRVAAGSKKNLANQSGNGSSIAKKPAGSNSKATPSGSRQKSSAAVANALQNGSAKKPSHGSSVAKKNVTADTSAKPAASNTKPDSVTAGKPAIASPRASVAPGLLLGANDASGAWKITSAMHSGEAVKAERIEKMGLTISPRDTVSAFIEIKQGDAVEKALVTFGGPIAVEGKTACPMTIVSNRPGKPVIQGLFYKENDGIVMIWNPPGKAGPQSIEPESNPAARVLQLSAAE